MKSFVAMMAAVTFSLLSLNMATMIVADEVRPAAAQPAANPPAPVAPAAPVVPQLHAQPIMSCSPSLPPTRTDSLSGSTPLVRAMDCPLSATIRICPTGLPSITLIKTRPRHRPLRHGTRPPPELRHGGFSSIGAMWMNSPAHRAALLDPTIRWIGLAGSGAYWTFNAF